MCKLFNTTNRFSAEQSIKKAPILEFIFTQFLLNYTTFARKISGTACKSTGPPGSGLVKVFLLAAQENIEIQTIYTYIHIYKHIHTALKHVY